MTLAADTPETTAAGVTFTAPAGWAIALQPGIAILTGPEPDLRVAVVDSTATTADDAVAAAWHAMHPDFQRTLRLAQPHPGRRGWAERRDYDYETSPEEKRSLWAMAQRKGTAWTVTLEEGSDASFQRRSASVALIEDTLHPQGYVEESFAGKAPRKLGADGVKEIVDAMERLRVQAGAPGAAMVLVQDGQVVYEGGLGVRELGKPARVDAHTRFLIASNTKALTTLLLAKLVDEGKLGWDTPVASVFPGFKLGDADTTSRVLVRHLVCACTGVPRQDVEWQFGKLTPRGLMDVIATMQPTTRFGETFQYSNPLASAAGYVAGHVVDPSGELGAAYEAAMQSRVLGPLGMTETTFDMTRALREAHAAPYERDLDGKVVLADIALDRPVLATRPSGGAWSTPHDMAKYLMMELARGVTPDGKRVVSEPALLERRRPQVKMAPDATYGMGLWVDTRWGVPVVLHNGAQMGFFSRMFFIPQAGVGGFFVTSGPGWMMPSAFVRKTVEVLYGGHAEAEEDAQAAIAEYTAFLATSRARLGVPPEPAVVATLAKRYTSSAAGPLRVITDGAQCVLEFGLWRSPVASRRNEDGTVTLVLIAPGTGLWPNELVVGTRDGKRTLTLRDAQHEYVYVESE